MENMTFMTLNKPTHYTFNVCFRGKAAQPPARKATLCDPRSDMRIGSISMASLQ